MRNKLPKFLPVGPHKVYVYREEIEAPAEGEFMAGYFTNAMEGYKIVLDSRLEGKMLLETYVHEALHAIDEIYKQKLKHRQIQGLANGLVQAGLIKL